MTSLCKCFLSVWFGGIRHFQFLFLGFPVSSPEHRSRLQRLLLLFEFPVCCKHFSMSDVGTGSHPVCSPGTDLTGATKSGPVAQFRRALVCLSGTMCSCLGYGPTPLPICACLKSARTLQITSSGAFPWLYLEGPFSVLCGYNSTSCSTHKPRGQQISVSPHCAPWTVPVQCVNTWSPADGNV